MPKHVYLLEYELLKVKFVLEYISKHAERGLKDDPISAKFWLGLIMAEIDNCHLGS